MKTFRIGHDGESITCLRCHTTSYNANDLRYRYCSACKEFHAEAKCDFCMAVNCDLPLEFESKSHIKALIDLPGIGRVVVEDMGIWMACHPCGELILNHKWEPLVERMVTGVLQDQNFIDDSPMSRRQIALRARVVLTAVMGNLAA